jgi:tRNA pseudouridine38-40 synthase
MPSFKITISYDGGGFVGWQRQAAGTSVQGLLEDALRELDQHDVAVAGAGRTDAGVHALGQVASFTVRRAIAAEVLSRALNARLPNEVRIVSAEEVPASFHARFDARSKAYRYRIWNADLINPFERAYAWHVQGPLDLAAMQTAARALEGRHDFASFQAADSARSSTERVVLVSHVVAHDASRGAAFDPATASKGPERANGQGCLLTYEISGNGFLRHMVRAITGSLVDVGRGRRSPEWLTGVVAARDRTQAGPTAPAHGLYLVRVDYGEKDEN